MLARRQPAEGLFHLASAGATTWFGFAKAIVELTAADRPRQPQLSPCTTADYPLPAMRPANSRLNGARLAYETGLALPDWQAALALCVAGRQLRQD
jgi:dTDP-4-dehydrorhamnose reductase